MRLVTAAHPGGGDANQGSLNKNPPLLLVSGATATLRRLSPHPHLGRFTQPRARNDLSLLATSGDPWAADNDALNPLGFDVDAYLAMVAGILEQPRDRLLFVTAPDAVMRTPDGIRGDWPGTLWLWRSWAQYRARRPLPWAIVAQDGADETTVPWDAIACLFIGGSDAWKDGPDCARLMRAARDRGVWVHAGRVNTQRRERLLWPLCDSFDGSGYSMYPDTLIPACLARIAAGQSSMLAELI